MLIMFRPKDSLDRILAIGIIAKGLNGLAELVSAAYLLRRIPKDRASAGTPPTSVQELQQ
jgi:hypothetical protein